MKPKKPVFTEKELDDVLNRCNGLLTDLCKTVSKHKATPLEFMLTSAVIMDYTADRYDIDKSKLSDLMSNFIAQEWTQKIK